jgi:hypothetical protein
LNGDWNSVEERRSIAAKHVHLDESPCQQRPGNDE